jgi:pilus assembly protein CpaC
MPHEQDVRVTATRDSIVLSGRVSSTQSLSQLVDLARGFAPEDQIRNLLEVTGIHQVMLEVRVSEISKSLLNRLGVNLMYTNGGSFGLGLPGKLANLAEQGSQTLPLDSFRSPGLVVSQSVDAIFRIQSGNASWTGLIDALREEGLVKVLAEPTLITLSGQEAKFLVGGEYPIPVPQGLGTVAIDYKEFGVRLRFTPTVLSENKISMKVTPEVSELDFSTAVQFQGFVVPGLTTRKADTVIELSDGQTFVIAGLLRDTVRDIIDKYPFLGDIPVLGNLFRSRSFQRNETELVIIATPHLVTPLEKQNQPLPTDFYVEPNEVDFYVWGALEPRAPGRAPPVKVKVDGDFGHSIPQLP